MYDIPLDTVANNNGRDIAPIRWGYSKYFIRDAIVMSITKQVSYSRAPHA